MKSLMARRKMMPKFLIFLLLFLPSTIFAQDFLPEKPVGFVNDFADVLSDSEVRILENKLSNYRDTTTNAIVVATIESLEGYSIEEIATNLFNTWDIQYENRANGVLLLVSLNDRKLRIEVGYGLEGAIPDLIAGRIIDEIITPNFRNGSYFGGIDQATTAMMQLAAGEYEGNLTRERSNDDEFDPFPIIIFIIIMILLFTRRGRRSRSYGPGGFIYWGGVGSSNRWNGGSGSSGFGGGGSFGGFGGGGGFSSGGGGASGEW